MAESLGGATHMHAQKVDLGAAQDKDPAINAPVDCGSRTLCIYRAMLAFFSTIIALWDQKGIGTHRWLVVCCQGEEKNKTGIWGIWGDPDVVVDVAMLLIALRPHLPELRSGIRSRDTATIRTSAVCHRQGSGCVRIKEEKVNKMKPPMNGWTLHSSTKQHIGDFCPWKNSVKSTRDVKLQNLSSRDAITWASTS